MLDYCVCTCIVLVPTLTATFYSSEPWGGLCTIQIYIKVLVRILIPADRSIYRKHNTYIFSCECQTITRLLADDFNFNPHINKSFWIFDRLLLPCWFQKVSLTINYKLQSYTRFMFSNVQTTSCHCPFFLFLFSILKSKIISQIFELVYIAGACKTFCLGNQASIFKKK